MIDFTSCAVNKFKAYGGANGNKINILYKGTSYMLKFPPVPSKSKAMSYTNSCISEYLACHIFKSIGIPAQETLLGTYTDKRGKEKIVVACRDFTENGKRLMEFAHLKNTCVDSEQSGYGTELSSILKAIDEQALISSVELRAFFWEMFVADALLGNFDRHNGNWGILIDEQKQTAEIAPVYDCGSCLFPQLDGEHMEKVLNSEDEINQRIYVFPTSAIMENGKKISYFEFISSLQNEECNAALQKIFERIDIDKIERLIEATPVISRMQKDFYKTMILERKEKIFDYSMNLLMK
ncbi:HipA domain-containing protein [Anaerosacchariphilus polymeriproducens]|uniref:CtkA family protein n=1 Tax=Anaerosacchariphilus polymeriproducens TaxID=1812858 RepID=A0A371AZD5_9FIRM|nr:HipA domain-containing protein [Anaerosacchariphilus polymeriproducens]RDU24909.1 CtkA family protein [Anaerosacchariphilus polymeriproducens]